MNPKSKRMANRFYVGTPKEEIADEPTLIEKKPKAPKKSGQTSAGPLHTYEPASEKRPQNDTDDGFDDNGEHKETPELSKKERTKTWQMLKWLGQQPDGATLQEIQHQLYVVINGNPEEDFWEKDVYDERYNKYPKRRTRGYWNTNLFGTDGEHGGVLHRFAEKVGKKWVLKRMPEKDELLYDPASASRRYGWNQR